MAESRKRPLQEHAAFRSVEKQEKAPTTEPDANRHGNWDNSRSCSGKIRWKTKSQLIDRAGRTLVNMKIGILQCDDVSPELQPEFGNYPAMFESKLGDVAPEFQFVTYRVVDGELPATIDECDGYITTGSRYGVHDGFPWIDKLEAFVLALACAGKKYVGICFGHQVLVKALGGKSGVSERGWGVGLTAHDVDVEKRWMNPARKSLKLVASHQDQVHELPQGVEILASSAFCPYYMLQYGANMMSVQGHPEFSKSYSNALMDKRSDIVPAPRIRDGRASLVEDADDVLMMRWIVNFFKEGHAG